MGGEHTAGGRPIVADEPMRDALALWKLLYADTGGYLALFSGRRSKEGSGGSHNRLVDTRSLYFRYPVEAGKAARKAVEVSRAGREALFCTHLLTNSRRVKESAAPVNALWADYDEPRLPDGMPEPSAVVRTSPRGHHLYWRLARPLSPPTAEALNRRLSYAIGADRSGWPLTKLGRAPGTANHKYPDTPEVCLKELDTGAVYHPRELDLCLPSLEQYEPRKARRRETQTRETLALHSGVRVEATSRLSPKMRELVELGNEGAGRPYPSRSEADFAVAIAMFGAGYDENDVWAVMTDRAKGISEKYQAKGANGVSYLVHTIGKARCRALPRRALPGRRAA